MSPRSQTTTTLLRASAAQYQAIDPLASIWVSASAGTGKTKVLTDRVLALLLQGSPVHRLLCLTYTKAAATEMANRLQAILGRWVHMADDRLADAIYPLLRLSSIDQVNTSDLIRARHLFAKVLDAPGGLKIMTLHAFCQSVLKRFPLEAGIVPHFNVIEDRTTRELLKEAYETILQQARTEADPHLSEAIAFLAIQIDETNFAQQLNTLLSHRMRFQQILHHYGSIDALCQQIWDALNISARTTPTTLSDDFCRTQKLPVPILQALATALQLGSSTDQKSAALLQEWLDAGLNQRKDLLEHYKTIFLTQQGTLKVRFITKKAAALFTPPEGFSNITAPADALLREEAEHMLVFQQQLQLWDLAKASDALLRVGYAILKKYQTLKVQRAQMDYDDLIQATQSLLSNQTATQWVLYKLDGGLDHILIDEAQDTNPEQWDIIKALSQDFFSGVDASEKPPTLFVVGDIKQSIYSFQRADPDRFQEMQLFFKSSAQQAGHNFHTVPMVTSFRSTATILGFIDHLFANPTYQEGVQSDPIHHDIARVADPGKVTLWPLACAAEKEDHKHWQLPIPEHMAPPTDNRQDLQSPPSAFPMLAQTIATEICHWINHKRLLPGKGRPIRAGDIMILIQKRPGIASHLISALQQANLPVAGADRLQLTTSLAVQDLLAVGQFCLLPEDDLTLANVLKSPLIGLSDQDLFALCRPWAKREQNRWHISLWSALSRFRYHDRAKAKTKAPDHQTLTPKQISALSQAVSRLTEWLNLADRLPPYEFYAHILLQCSGRHALLTRLGANTAELIDEFVSLALLYERTHPPTLQGFLSWMGGGETEIKREMDQSDQDQIRVMTIYGAKGLQAPIVIIPDANRVAKTRHHQFWPEFLDLPPHLRQKWPAFLYAPQKKANLLSDLDQALRKSEMAEYRRLLYVALTRAEDELILCGTQTSKTTPQDPSWYDMARTTLAKLAEKSEAVELDLNTCFATPPTDRQRWTGSAYRYQLTGASQTMAASDCAQDTWLPESDSSAQQDLPAWIRQTAPIHQQPAKPLIPSRPQSEDYLAQSPLIGQQSDIFLRGRLIHRLLELLPTHPKQDWERAALSYLALPLHGLSVTQQKNYWQEVYKILTNTHFAPLFDPNSQSEVSLTGIIRQNGRATVISGQVDRLVVTKDTVIIIDYKTNQPPPSDPKDVPETYHQQLAAYRLLLADMYPERLIKTVLLWTDTCHLMEIKPS